MGTETFLAELTVSLGYVAGIVAQMLMLCIVCAFMGDAE